MKRTLLLFTEQNFLGNNQGESHFRGFGLQAQIEGDIFASEQPRSPIFPEMRDLPFELANDTGHFPAIRWAIVA